MEECHHEVAMFLVHWDEVLHCLFSYRALLQLGVALGQLPKGMGGVECKQVPG